MIAVHFFTFCGLTLISFAVVFLSIHLPCPLTSSPWQQHRLLGNIQKQKQQLSQEVKHKSDHIKALQADCNRLQGSIQSSQQLLRNDPKVTTSRSSGASSTERPRSLSERDLIPNNRSVASVESLPGVSTNQSSAQSHVTEGAQSGNRGGSLIESYSNALEREIARLRRENDRLVGLVDRMGGQIEHIQRQTTASKAPEVHRQGRG